MKAHKYLNKKVEVVWQDAKSSFRTSLAEMMESPFDRNHTYGVILHIDEKRGVLVVATEMTENDKYNHDLTCIPLGWVVEIKELVYKK